MLKPPSSPAPSSESPPSESPPSESSPSESSPSESSPTTSSPLSERPPRRHTFAQIVVYDLLRIIVRIVSAVFFRMRCKGRVNIPADGPVLVCANHQSSLDPPLIGLAFDRRLNYVARQGLFEGPLLRPVIEFFDAIPIDREGSGLAGIKEMLRRLKRGELVLVFPEGTRSEDGTIAPLKPGVIAVARRCRAPLLPVGIDGSFDAMPRSAVLPRPAVVHLIIGEPMTHQLVESLDDDALLAELERRIRACHATAQAGRKR